MRLFRRPLIPGEPDPELLWGSVLGVSSLLGASWLLWGFPTPLCPIHALTGFPCPTCGITRATGALLRGHPVQALSWNPLATLGLAGTALYVLYAAVVVIGKLPRLRWTPPSRSESRWIRICVILLLTANWAYLICWGV